MANLSLPVIYYSLGKRMFGERSLLPFFMHSKRNGVLTKQSQVILGQGRDLGWLLR